MRILVRAFWSCGQPSCWSGGGLYRVILANLGDSRALLYRPRGAVTYGSAKEEKDDSPVALGAYPIFRPVKRIYSWGYAKFAKCTSSFTSQLLVGMIYALLLCLFCLLQSSVIHWMCWSTSPFLLVGCPFSFQRSWYVLLLYRYLPHLPPGPKSARRGFGTFGFHEGSQTRRPVWEETHPSGRQWHRGVVGDHVGWWWFWYDLEICVNIAIYIYIYISLSLSLSIYLYIYTHYFGDSAINIMFDEQNTCILDMLMVGWMWWYDL